MAPPLKHGLGRDALTRLAQNIARGWPAFGPDAFVDAAMVGLEELELKQRVAHVADVLAGHLPSDYREALAILVAAGGETWDRGDESDPLRGFAAWPLFDFIAHRGVHDFEASMAALRRLTHLFSAEFAVRPFIARYPERAFAELMRWTEDESEQVRRLVSEGTRSRLPWATKVQALIDDAGPTLRLLEALKDDEALYVRRSVANNLNDLAKDHADLVVDTCEAWSEGASKERRWVIERATRTLVKVGHPRVWGLLGFTKRASVSASALRVEAKSVAMGDELGFTFDLESTADTKQRLAVDYAVHYVKANGKTRPKVFKLRVLELAPGQRVELSRSLSFRAISTRKYYPGVHAIEVLVNGESGGCVEFELTR